MEVRWAATTLAPLSLDAPTGAEDEDGAAALIERIGRPDDGFGQSELRDELEQALAELDPPAGTAVRLRIEEELTFGEVAERIGVSPSHASKLVENALRTLRAALTTRPLPVR
jgi:RNA polymerase sigma factor (sigma-70 family)